MKNYFSDVLIVEMANNCGASVHRYNHGEDDFTLRMSELKALMNLAVETAKGEVVTNLVVRDGFVYSTLWVNIPDDGRYTLHLIQELDN